MSKSGPYRICGLNTVLQIFLVFVFVAQTASSLGLPITNAPEITALTENGTLTWVDASTTGAYRVEWTSSLLEEWRNSFDSLSDIPPGSNGVTTVKVPMFYRVVRMETEQGTDGAGNTLVLDATHPSEVLVSNSEEPKSLWATARGVIFELEIFSPNAPTFQNEDGSIGFMLAVGGSIDVTARATPEIPGFYQWSTESTNLTIQNADRPTATLTALHSATSTAVRAEFRPAHPYWDKDLYCLHFEIVPQWRNEPSAEIMRRITGQLRAIADVKTAVVVDSDGFAHILFEEASDVSAVTGAVLSLATDRRIKIEVNYRRVFNQRYRNGNPSFRMNEMEQRANAADNGVKASSPVSRPAVEKTLASIVIPELVFDDEPVHTAIGFLIETARKKNPGKTPIQAIFLIPEAGPKTVSFSARGITVLDAFKAICELTKLDLRVGKEGMITIAPTSCFPKDDPPQEE